MSVSEENESKTVISCTSTVDIKIAVELFEHLSSAIESHRAVEINAEDVERIDTAVLQLFLAFVLEAKTKEVSITWLGVSDAFVTAANLLGIGSQLALPDAARS